MLPGRNRESFHIAAAAGALPVALRRRDTQSISGRRPRTARGREAQ
jgi:hypothetical protein